MLISYKWLQSYFEKKLPLPEKLAERITFGFAEVESIEKSPLSKGALPSVAGGLSALGKTTPAPHFSEKVGGTPFGKGDTVLDLKVLPDRACYALSHRGVAYEVGAILGLKRKEFNWPQPEVQKTRKISVKIEAPDLCSRYIARVIECISPREMPWVKEHLEAVGQRTIHPVVDGANIVMFDMGQPLHAFDADEVEGGIVVRRARKGEKLTTLDNREVLLDESVLIIADEKSPLAIAGIKGGKKAEVTAATRNLILESANFNASHTRKTSERLGIKTDASKRFENKLSPEMANVGMNDFTALLFEMDKRIKAGEVIDVYGEKQQKREIAVTADYLSKKIGLPLSSRQIEEVLKRLLIHIKKKGDVFMLTPPSFRMDLNIPEDIAEEVARIVGYDKIPSVLLIPLTKGGARVGEGGGCEVPKEFYYEWKIREILTSAGFSEVMTSSFAHGVEGRGVEIANPLASDKNVLRPYLLGKFSSCLDSNFRNSLDSRFASIRIFEIGKVFPWGEPEYTSLAIGYLDSVRGSNAKSVVERTVRFLSVELGVPLEKIGKQIGGNHFEVSVDEIIKSLPEPTQWDISIPPVKGERFKPFSLYPFIVRDIALFIPPEIEPEVVAKVIKENAGSLVVHGPELFDEFSREGKKSLAFRLVFQSLVRTLSDDEVNKAMEKIYPALKGKGWEVR